MTTDRHYTAQQVGEDIFETSYYTAPKKVGVAIEKYDALHKEYTQLVPLFTEYQEKLIALGEIKIPKTPEEICQEQAEQLQETRLLLDRVSQQLAVLTGVSNGLPQHNLEGSDRETKNEGDAVGSV